MLTLCILFCSFTLALVFATLSSSSYRGCSNFGHISRSIKSFLCVSESTCSDIHGHTVLGESEDVKNVYEKLTSFRRQKFVQPPSYHEPQARHCMPLERNKGDSRSIKTFFE